MLYPLRDKINIFIYPAIFGVSRWLPFEEENKEIYQSGLVFAFPDAYQMGEKFSKSFIKIEFSCSIPWEEKINFRKNLIFFAFPCSTPWGDLSEISEAIHKIRVFVLYHLREKNIYGKGAVFDHPRCLPIEGKKYIFSKGLIFSLSRDLPLEGRKLQNRHNFWPLPVGTSEEIFKTEVKKRVSRWLLFGREIFWKHPAKWLFSLGISEEKIIPWNPHISNFLAGYSLGEQNFFENTY